MPASTEKKRSSGVKKADTARLVPIAMPSGTASTMPITVPSAMRPRLAPMWRISVPSCTASTPACSDRRDRREHARADVEAAHHRLPDHAARRATAARTSPRGKATGRIHRTSLAMRAGFDASAATWMFVAARYDSSVSRMCSASARCVGATRPSRIRPTMLAWFSRQWSTCSLSSGSRARRALIFEAIVWWACLHVGVVAVVDDGLVKALVELADGLEVARLARQRHLAHVGLQAPSPSRAGGPPSPA